MLHGIKKIAMSNYAFACRIFQRSTHTSLPLFGMRHTETVSTNLQEISSIKLGSHGNITLAIALPVRRIKCQIIVLRSIWRNHRQVSGISVSISVNQRALKFSVSLVTASAVIKYIRQRPNDPHSILDDCWCYRRASQAEDTFPRPKPENN